uniref:Uncharacterized protein n=1 Tax=Siphoviridae sp. ctGkF2 TaxID=2827823 RepID=A0A8S5TLK7_9CAUD|nr:MAG TPA: hypothetical protein [Siphoviridae sp. ctGkF2]
MRTNFRTGVGLFWKVKRYGTNNVGSVGAIVSAGRTSFSGTMRHRCSTVSHHPRSKADHKNRRKT